MYYIFGGCHELINTTKFYCLVNLKYVQDDAMFDTRYILAEKYELSIYK